MQVLDNTPALKVREIFLSLQGESSRVGLPTVFVRLTGCPLRCVWCDTPYAFTGGQSMTVAQVVSQVSAYGVTNVCVTGGEPLAQAACLPLLSGLCDAGHSVALETSGALDIGAVDPRVARVVDLKPPGSGETRRNHWPNLSYLTRLDEVKFVLGNRADYEWSRQIITAHRLASVCSLLFSPVHGVLDDRTLAEWILADRLPVRFQLQLHKVLWGNIPGR